MKKILFVITILFVLTGCSKGEEVNCVVRGEKAVFTLKDGIVSSFVLNGKKQSMAEVDEINGTYFTSSTTNEEGKLALKNYVSSLGGSCN